MPYGIVCMTVSMKFGEGELGELVQSERMTIKRMEMKGQHISEEQESRRKQRERIEGENEGE
jgi:hypothetical protein